MQIKQIHFNKSTDQPGSVVLARRLGRFVLLPLQLGGEVHASGRVHAGGGQHRHQVLHPSSGHRKTPGISFKHSSETWVTF